MPPFREVGVIVRSRCRRLGDVLECLVVFIAVSDWSIPLVVRPCSQGTCGGSCLASRKLVTCEGKADAYWGLALIGSSESSVAPSTTVQISCGG